MGSALPRHYECPAAAALAGNDPSPNNAANRADYAEDVSWNDASTSVNQATQLIEAIQQVLFPEQSNENSRDDDLEDQSDPAPQ